VANVLSQTTGLVSPQFHVTFDPSFHTVKQDDYDGLWQIKAGFVNQKGEAIKPIPMKTALTMVTAEDVPEEIYCLEAMFPNYAGERKMDPLTVLKATTDPDTLYWHEAMQEPNRKEFRAAMEKEWNNQINNGNLFVIHKSKAPKNATILPAVWQMKRKRDIRT
jgi:hypothetical protein